MSSRIRHGRGLRSLLAGALVVSVCLATVRTAAPIAAKAGGKSEFVKMACGLPPNYLLRLWRGTDDRSGDLIVIPKIPNFLGGGLPHAGPWDYVERVPIFWYGPGFINETGSVKQPVTLADIAPTEAQLLQYSDFSPIDGKPMKGVIAPGAQTAAPPKLLVTLVWDAGGRDVLDTWSKDWPYLHSLIPHGVWFENATVGSAPTDTPPSHATIGTGDYPANTGMLDQHERVGNEIVAPWASGPTLLLQPTLADLYDRAMSNKPVVAEIASLSSHLGLIGHGSMWGGGDKDIVVTHENLGDEGSDAGVQWNVRPNVAPFFTFPKYVNDLPPVQHYARAIDQQDGAYDGKWLTNPIDQLQSGWDTPARTPYETAAIEAVVKKEKMGKDKTPDMLLINYKLLDQVGHKYSINSPEMSSSVKTQDDALKILVKYLDRKVGKGEWAMVLTADHGHQFDPNVSGAYPINPKGLISVVNQHFGGTVIQEVRPTQIWLNSQGMSQTGTSETDIANYILTLTKSQIPTADVSTPASQANDKLFDVVFPSQLFNHLPCLPDTMDGETMSTAKGPMLHPTS